jgi:hypothetical protein
VQVFEDDTQIKPKTLTRLVKILHEGRLPADWDMLRLMRSTADSEGELSVDTEGEGLVDATTVVTGRNGQNGLRVVKRAGCWTGAYVLTRHACRRLLASGLELCAFNIDDFLFACAQRHPRNDLMHTAPVLTVRASGPFICVSPHLDDNKNFFGVDFTAESYVGDCF